jgi:hypothetical protein
VALFITPEYADLSTATKRLAPSISRLIARNYRTGDAAVRRHIYLSLASLPFLLGACAGTTVGGDPHDDLACARVAADGSRRVADDRTDRFLGKVAADTARCRGGDTAVRFRGSPYVDWANYWAAGDASSLAPGSDNTGSHLGRNRRGIDGALLDLEYQRIELIKFNLFDNDGTYKEFKMGREGTEGPALKVWDAMRLPRQHPSYDAVGGAAEQLCRGELIRFRNLDGICNDLRNPLMGATNQSFARNVQFESTFPDLGRNQLARNRHGDRLGLLKPDPQLISRTLFTRAQLHPERCNEGNGLPGYSVEADCDYKKAPAFNVLAAFWVQFMTHDWFSHLEEGHNDFELTAVGCATQRVGDVEKPLDEGEIQKLGCRPGDRMDTAYIAQNSDPALFEAHGKQYLTRAYKTTRNTVTAWWDASQLYGYDDTSRRRVKRDGVDSAKLRLEPVGAQPGLGDQRGYLPLLDVSDPVNPQWSGQEATAFSDNWSVGLSFYHNLFAREHNAFVDAFRKQARDTPDADSGLRNPTRPDVMIRYQDVSGDELFEVARLVVAAEIAKIHTTEWTPQLLYNEPLYKAANANWGGLLDEDDVAATALAQIVTSNFGASKEARKAAQWYSVLASGPGIFGLGSRVYADESMFAMRDPGKSDLWSLKNPGDVNGGVNHFGSPFNFPEEFVSVYRLHALVPDLLEYRVLDNDPNVIRSKIPVVETFRAKATPALRQRGIGNWALSMGRQRSGLLTLQNAPQFLQNLGLPRLHTATNKIDVVALDIIRDRERGVPRFNELRRQYGLKQLRSFDDFVDQRLAQGSPERMEQERLMGLLRKVYGTHRCDASKIITVAQLNDDGTPITDCLGSSDGSMVDNVEDVDTVVGWLSEFTRPHGFAISETQLQVFILNASRRLFSDRFFTSSFRSEFYTQLGIKWVTENGPDGKLFERSRSNGHKIEISPLKRVLLRNISGLQAELDPVINAFDPWARDRNGYYSLQWKARPDAQADPAFDGTEQRSRH